MLAAVFEVPGPTPLGIAASTAAYRDGGPWLDELVTYLAANRDRLGELVVEHLPGVAWHPPAATFLAWLDCAARSGRSGALVPRPRQSRAQRRATIRAGCEQFVRLNFATSSALLERILRAMGDAVGG